MAIKKTGDPIPIKGFYSDDMELQVCEKCQKPLTVVALDNEGNDIICTCDTEQQDKQSSAEN